MASKSQRAMALVLALLFLATSLATGAVVIWQIREENKAKQVTNNTPADSLPNALNPEDQLNQQEEQPNMLQGTQLTGFTPTASRVTELQIIDTVEGTGPAAKKGDKITAHYTGAVVATGMIFQSSLDTGSPFNATVLTPEESTEGRGLIVGWVEGIPGMKVGGTRRLIIPAAKAYGASGNPPSIPADADLVFDIQLVSIN